MMAVMNGIMDWGMLAQRKDRAVFYIMSYVAIFSLAANLIFIPHFGAMGASIINLSSETLMAILFFTSNVRALKDVPMTESEISRLKSSP